MLSGSALRSSTNFSDFSPEGAVQGGPMDFRTMIGALAQRWKLILAVPAICLTVTFFVLRCIPPVYQSSVEILLFDPQWQIETVNGQQAPHGDFDTVAINTEIEVIRSAALSLRVARELRLDQYVEFQHGGRLKLLLDYLGLSQLAPRLQQLLEQLGLTNRDSLIADSEIVADPAKQTAKRNEVAAARLREILRVDRAPLSYVLVISASSHNPGLARRLAATVVDDYLADQRETRQRALQQRGLWLKDRLSELKSGIVETETAIEKLKAQSGLSDTGKGSVTQQQIADLNAQLMLARAEVTEKRAQLDQARQPSDSSRGVQAIFGATTSPLIGQLRLQQSELVRREAELRSKLGDRHPEVLAVAAQVASITKAISDEAERFVADLQGSWNIAVRREQSLAATLQRLTATQSDSGDYVKLQQLRRAADADRKLYEAYLSQYNEVGTQSSLQVAGARIITPAALPSAPSFPRHQLLFYLGAINFGLAMGVILALFIEYWRPRVRTWAQAEQMFGYPVVGAVPFMRKGKTGFGNASDEFLKTVVKKPRSPLSEAVRTLRVGLNLPHRQNAPTVILVTSCLPGEGKSAIAMLLTASSAAAHRRTVLVDCDFRGRTVSQKFGDQGPGLTDLLAGSVDIAAATLCDAATGCFVIPAGSSCDSPEDLLFSKTLGELISQLKAHYDYIILDTAPLLAFSDALALAPMADRILLTVDNCQADCEQISEAFRLLRFESDRVAGMVFNKLSPSKLGRFRYGGYYANTYRNADR